MPFPIVDRTEGGHQPGLEYFLVAIIKPGIHFFQVHKRVSADPLKIGFVRLHFLGDRIEVKDEQSPCDFKDGAFRIPQ